MLHELQVFRRRGGGGKSGLDTGVPFAEKDGAAGRDPDLTSEFRVLRD